MTDVRELIKTLKKDIQLQQKSFEIEKKKELEKVQEIFEECGGCRKCGNCCTEVPPQLSNEDVVRICKHLDMHYEEFEGKYIQWKNSSQYLKMSCPFLTNEYECSIHSVRPEQCKWYPFNPVAPYLYQIQISDECELAHEIDEKYKNFMDTFEGELEMPESIRDFTEKFFQTVQEEKSQETSSLEGASDKELPHIVTNTKTLTEFLKWLRKQEGEM